MLKAAVIIHDEVVRAKLLAAEPRILAQNRALVTSVLEMVKPVEIAETPLGPGHFGYHGRDTVRIDIKSKGIKTVGELKAAVQLYWREYGTRGRFKGPKKARLRHDIRIMTGGLSAGGGERAFLVAHKALAGAKRFIGFYYNGMANWWRL